MSLLDPGTFYFIDLANGEGEPSDHSLFLAVADLRVRFSSRKRASVCGIEGQICLHSQWEN